MFSLFPLRRRAALACALNLFAPSVSTAASLPANAVNKGSGRAAAPPLLDPNRARHPRASLHNFSGLLDAPAGKKGFLTSRDGHFYWPDGTRARFWGINVANTSLQASNAEIDAIIANFRASGFNLLRLHHFDERGGIIDMSRNDSRQFIPARLKKLDYWIYKAKQAGIYVYIDLLDYRRFKPGDGVPNAEAIGRAGRPYNVFDPRLIELQKEYARKLLRDHVNPYTGLAYADDPAIVMMEIYDESGLFMRRGTWRAMPQPYARQFHAMWNAWLRAQYSSTDALRRAWSQGGKRSELQPNESLERGTVQVPALTWTPQSLPVSQRAYAGLARKTDASRWAYTLHRKFFREMKTYLRDIGVRVPVCVTGRFDDIADLRSMSGELDFIGTNFYYDHPSWAAKKPAWTPPSYYHNSNPMSHIDELSFAAQIGLAKVADKPLVVREWNYCWPNRNRAAGMIEAASYASLHDIDAMILFVYENKPTPRVSYFNVRSDPARWGLAALGSQIFLRNLISPSRFRVVVPYNPLDSFTYTRFHQPFYALGWATRVENAFYDLTYRADSPANTLIMSPGRTGLGQLEGAPAVLWSNDQRRDVGGQTGTAPDYLRSYGLSTVRAGKVPLSYDGLLYEPRQQLTRDLPFALPLGQVTRNGYRPIGENLNANLANGFLDTCRRRFVFGNLDSTDALRAGLDALQEFYGVPNAHDANDQNIFTSDTGELYRDAASGRLIVSAPQVQALCGNLVGAGRVLAPGLRARNLKNGALVAVSLDGRPLVESRNYVIKMVTDARNKDEQAKPDPRFASRAYGQWKLSVLGEGPVTTRGAKAPLPVQIGIERRPLVDVYQSGGSWELLVNGNEWKFWSDVPGARVTLHKASGALQEVRSNGSVRALNARTGQKYAKVPYPAGAALLRAAG